MTTPNKPTITASTFFALTQPFSSHFNAEFFGWVFEDNNNAKKWMEDTLKSYSEQFHFEPGEWDKIQNYFKELIFDEESDEEETF